MKRIVVEEYKLKDFPFWSGAKDTVAELSEEQMETLDNYLTEIQDDSYNQVQFSDTEINDFFWFDRDNIADILGFDDWDSFLESKEKS